MARMRFTHSNQRKKCRLCNEEIAANQWCLVIENVHVSPKHVDLFWHEGCFMRALDYAKATRNGVGSADEEPTNDPT